VKPSGLHLLLTYKCIFECDHCFVWSSPRQSGTMTLLTIDLALRQAKEAGIEWIYFEGGEPFLFYAVLCEGVERASKMGFRVGLVTNAYWATDPADAELWLSPFKELIGDFSVSGDLYHDDEVLSESVSNAVKAAQKLGIPASVITVAQPGEENALPLGAYCVRYRGRAAAELAGKAKSRAWSEFAKCEHEELRNPGRLHLDPYGNLHVCQGIIIGNIFRESLKDIAEGYDPEGHPIVGALLEGGPVALVERYGAAHAASYADCCQLCDEARRELRERFAEQLAPDQMYGPPED
jgi:MoaA/NifB/PqqE/SkfB family radical SAM enzyme